MMPGYWEVTFAQSVSELRVVEIRCHLSTGIGHETANYGGAVSRAALRTGRPVGAARAGVRPRAGRAAAQGAHLHFVGGAGLQALQREAGRLGGDGAAVGGPLGGALLAVLHLVAGDGHALDGSRRRPAHVQAGRMLALILRALERGRTGLANGVDMSITLIVRSMVAAWPWTV